jgi:hypothetical protein
MIRVVNPGFGSRIRILIFLPIPDPGFRVSRIPDPDTQNWFGLKSKFF